MLLPKTFITLLLSLSRLASASTVDLELDRKLDMAPTTLNRMALLGNDSRSWLFDFAAQDSYSYSPGSVVNANAASWPASVSNELTMALISMGPCSMLAPHYHPKGSNYVMAISGRTTTHMLAENGAPLISQTLTPLKMTIFPRASLHAMVNDDCERNATLVSALSSPDAGTHNVVNALFNLPDNIVNAAFGNPAGGARAFGKSVPGVGFNAIQGEPSCLARCRAANEAREVA